MIMDRRLLPLVELATVLLTLSIIVGFRRLFVDDSFMGPLVVVAVVTHLLAIALRRFGRGLLVTAVTTLAALIGVVTIQHYSATARWFIPTSDSRELLRVDLQTAWDVFGEVAAPTEALTGFLVLSSVGIWLCAFLIDWAAFRLGSKIETLLPPAALFGFQAVVGGDRGRVAAAVAFGAAAAFFVLSHRVASLERDGRWLSDDAGPGHLALLRGGAVVSASAVLMGLAVGPLLPGADDEALVQFQPSGEGDGTRWVENPLVDIRSKLFEQSDAVMFTVTTTAEPDYWRMLSLHEFDGRQWSTSDSYVGADAALTSAQPRELGTERVNTQFVMVNLVSNWVPAAYEAHLVTAPDFTPNWSPNTGALLMPEGRPLESGDYYTVVSQIPDRDVAAVARSGDEIPDDIAEVYLDLPSDFSSSVRDEAQRIVGGATTPYEQALALQDFFRDGSFTYDLQVAAGHSTDDIESFLFDVRAGYCEQFAGSFAAMARSVGLPTRVAVGFTPGGYNPDRGWYEVRGTNAHAWPEVWFADAGWVRFEPTPDRGLPRDEPVTGLPPVEIQNVVSDPAATDGVTVPTTVPPPTITRPAVGQVPQGGEADRLFSGVKSRTDRGPLLVVFFVIAAIGAVVAMLWAAKHQHHRRLRSADAPVRVQVSRAWDEALDGLAMTGTTAQEAETVNEFSIRAGERVNDRTAHELAQLAQLTTSARYSGTDLEAREGHDARALATGIRTYCNAQVSRPRRLLWELDPRPMFRPRR